MKHRQGGFTLFETLVAMTIMAMLLGALLPVFQGGLETLRYGSRQTRAALLAQSLLTRALVQQTAQELQTPYSGESDGLHWQVQRKPYIETELPGADEDQSNSPALWELSARVEWGDGHFVVLRGVAPALMGIRTRAGAS